MDLWIKGQAKNGLIKPTDIEIDSESIGDIICNYKNDDNYWVLGTYKSKERAMEIIDDIHQRIIDLQTVEMTPDFYKTAIRNLDCVYEMPEE